MLQATHPRLTHKGRSLPTKVHATNRSQWRRTLTTQQLQVLQKATRRNLLQRTQPADDHLQFHPELRLLQLRYKTGNGIPQRVIAHHDLGAAFAKVPDWVHLDIHLHNLEVEAIA